MTLSQENLHLKKNCSNIISKGMCSIISGVVFLSVGLLWIIKPDFHSSMQTFFKTRWKFALTWIVFAQISTSNSSHFVAFKLKYSKNINFQIPIAHFHPFQRHYILKKKRRSQSLGLLLYISKSIYHCFEVRCVPESKSHCEDSQRNRICMTSAVFVKMR